MLYNRFTRAERSRNSGYTALCKRKECVNRSLTCCEKNIRRELSLVRSAHTNRPFCKHFNFGFFLAVVNYGNNLVNCKVALADFFNSALNLVRNEDFVQNSVSFLDSAEHIACNNLVTRLYFRGKVPFLVVVERGNVNASFEVCSCDLHNFVKRALNTVVD